MSYIDPEGTFALPIFLGIAAGVFYATDLDTPGAAQDELVGVPLAAAGGAGGGKSGRAVCEAGAEGAQAAATKAFGKGGLLNSNRYFRIGVGGHGGRRVFRAAGEVVQWLERRGVPGIENGHIDFYDFGPK